MRNTYIDNFDIVEYTLIIINRKNIHVIFTILYPNIRSTSTNNIIVYLHVLPHIIMNNIYAYTPINSQLIDINIYICTHILVSNILVNILAS